MSEPNKDISIREFDGSDADYEAAAAMFNPGHNLDASYSVLGVTDAATDHEVKKAYRTMAKKYHPDRVGHLGKEHQEGAEAKFREVQEAYEHIQKERGFK